MIILKNLTIKKASEKLKKGDFTSVELTQACLDNIKDKNNELNIFLEVFDDVLEQAKLADEMIKKGEGTELTGIPIAIKDNMLIMGKKKSSASLMLGNYVATYDAYVIKQLKKVRAVLIGRTNMDEFAMGSSTENSAYNLVKNPVNIEYVPGGSSGGSAAAVAANMALGSLGSDTGSSVRLPASFCGVIGMKPTYGEISRFGVMALASSLDQVGSMAKTIEGAQIIFNCIRGKDLMDATSVSNKDKKVEPSLKVIGVPREFLGGVDKEVLDNFEKSLEKMKKMGYEIKDIDMKYLKYSLPVYYVIMPAEVSTNLARLEGIRYGVRIEGDNMFDTFRKSRSKGFGPETRRRMILGAYVLSHGYKDAYYKKAWKLRRAISKEFLKVFKEVDYVATPTGATTAFKIGEKVDPVAMYLSDVFTVPANIAGLPSISIPSGVSSKGLPFGFQLNGPRFSDDALFKVSLGFEKN